VWRTLLEANLQRGFVSEFELVRIYGTAVRNPADEDLRELLKRSLDVYQQRRGQIEDFFITGGEDWAVIRTVHRPQGWLPLGLASTVDTVFDIEKAKPAAVAQVFTDLIDLGVKSDNTLRGTDQVSFVNEVSYAFQTVVANVDEAAGGDVPPERVEILTHDVKRLSEMWATAVKRGVLITTLEGMALGVLAVVAIARGV
jgi:hypothetical protein